MKRPGSKMMVKQVFVRRCMFSITPVGPTGGGVYDGPSASSR
jgi:hypothetical protein